MAFLSDERLPPFADRYDLEELALGSGGSVLYRGRERASGTNYAIRHFPEAFEAGTAAADLWHQRWLQFGQLAGSIDHPGVAKIHLVAGDEYYLVSDFVDGTPVVEFSQRRALSLRSRVELALDLTSALAACHQVGLVHDRLKPSNVLVDASGRLRLVGLAPRRPQVLSSDSQPTLDPRSHFLAPEQVLGQRTDERTDVFAVGRLLYSLVTGESLFTSRSPIELGRQILNVNPAIVVDSHRVGNPELTALLRRAIARNPLSRFPSSVELHAQLRQIQASLPESGSDVASPTPSSPPPVVTANAYVVYRTDDKLRVHSLDQDRTTIGRGRDRDVRFDSEFVSRKHAVIERDAVGFLLRDDHSTLGTTVEGRGLIADNRIRLHDGDEVTIGNCWLRFHTELREPSPATLISQLVEGIVAASTVSPVHGVLSRMLTLAMQMTGAARGFVMLHERFEAEINLADSNSPTWEGFRVRVRRHVTGVAPRPTEEMFSSTILSRCVQRRGAELHRDAARDLPEAASVEGLAYKAIVVVPLVFADQVVGILQLDSPTATSPFDESQLPWLEVFASYSAMSLDHARWRQLATYDERTGLLRFEYYKRRLPEEFERARRAAEREPGSIASSLSLIFIDIDDFGEFNKTYGYAFADQVLREVASLIRSESRGHDTVARYGGDEFVILAPQTTADEATRVAERMRAAVASRRLRTPSGDELQLTVTCGVADMPAPGIVAAADLQARADRALQAVKLLGKNRVGRAEE